jgi:MerR family transcriptional regulator/heat shock protein HspR
MAYERIGLVKPARRSNRRMYSEDELRWLGCAQVMNREGGISLQGLSTLLRFVPCWAILSQVEGDRRGDCPPADHPAEDCLARVRRAYEGSAPGTCRTCGIYRRNREQARCALAPEAAGQTARS